MPRCLPHTIYKSYSASYVDNGRYDRLTEWLGEFTTEDLTGIDVTACDSLESWVDTLEAGSRLKPSVSWGTTGKVSFFPRSTVEADVFARSGFSSSMNERANYPFVGYRRDALWANQYADTTGLLKVMLWRL